MTITNIVSSIMEGVRTRQTVLGAGFAVVVWSRGMKNDAWLHIWVTKRSRRAAEKVAALVASRFSEKESGHQGPKTH